MKRIFLFLLPLGLLIVCLQILVEGAETAVRSSPVQLAFQDDFETDKGWTAFAEIVDGSSCYGSGIGAVYRTMDQALQGEYSLAVHANEALSSKSNHLLAQQKLYDAPVSGIFTYTVAAFVPTAVFTQGQTGPEYSMQNTRWFNSTFTYTTFIAGIQYQANPSLAANWAVWSETSPDTAGWISFTTQPISADTWYTLTLTADFINNRYISFTLQTANSQNPLINADLASYPIVAEEKGFTEEAFWLTLESENLWNNCGAAGNFEYVVYYDQVTLHATYRSYLPVIQRN